MSIDADKAEIDLTQSLTNNADGQSAFQLYIVDVDIIYIYILYIKIPL